METLQCQNNGFKIKIIFLFDELLFKIYIEAEKSNEANKFKFLPIKISYEDKLKKFSSNFADLYDQLKKHDINIEIENHLRYLDFNMIKNIGLESERLISKKIYALNVEYYLIKEPNHQRINSRPFFSYLNKDSFNYEDVLELMDQNDIFSSYKIDCVKYLNKEKGAFQILKNEDIPIKDKIILEFNIYETIDPLMTNYKWAKDYYIKEINKLKKIINKLTDRSKNFDLIYLYASPVVLKNFCESEAPISYMKEIRIIRELMKNKKKKYKCKLECINEHVLSDVLINNKTKILHISAHGTFDGNYSLIVEDLDKYGQDKKIKINALKSILIAGKKNINNIDLVIVSTCYSEDFGKLFLEYGAKNVIYTRRKTELSDDISVCFVKYFYQNLVKGKAIEDSYKDAMKLLKLNDEIILLNKKGCCCSHYHKKNCLLFETIRKNNIHDNIHADKSESCKCNYTEPNYHNKDCEYYKKLKNKLNEKEEYLKDYDESGKVNIMCCCDRTIEHNEINKIIYEKNPNDTDKYFSFDSNEDGDISIDSNIRFHFDSEKYIFILGRKNIMGKIFNHINANEENYSVLYGEKELLKTDFAESLCVYLNERKIIYDYEKFSINNQFDVDYLKYKINKDSEIIKNMESKMKNIKIIKYDFYNDIEQMKEFLNDIYQNISNEKIKRRIYCIFIIDVKIENKKEVE